MAVARLDTAVSTQVVAAGTLAYTVGAGSDRALVVTLSNETNGNTTHDSVLYGDQSMVKMADSATGTSGFTQRTSIWILLDAEIAAASSNVIDPTFGTTQPADLQIHAASYTGVDQTGGATTFPDTNTASSTAATPNPLISDITGVADGAVVAARGCGNNTTFTWQADLTEQTDQSDASSASSFADALTSAGGNVNVEGTAASQNRGAQAAAALAGASADVVIVVPVGSLTIDTTGTIPTAEITHIRQIPAGQLQISPLAPSAEETHIRGPPVGALSLTGLAPSAEITHVRQVPNTELHLVTFVGLYLNGQAPTISVQQQDVVVLPDAGSLTLTGLDPEKKEDHVTEMPVGSLSLTGEVPITDAGESVTKQPPAGTLTLTELLPTADETHNRAVPVGALTLTPLTPTADETHNRAVPAGSLSLTGFAPALSGSGSIAVPAGSLSVTGLAPRVELTVSNAFLTLAGKTPALEIIINNADSSLFFTGQAPTPLQNASPPDVITSPPDGSLALIGLTPQRGIGLLLRGYEPTVLGQITIETGDPNNPVDGETTATITGHAPERVANNIIEMPAGSLTLAGYAPSIPFLATPPIGTLDLIGLQPRVESPQITDPGPASLTLTGLAPTISRSDAEEEEEGFSGGHGWRNQYDAQVQRKRAGTRRRKQYRKAVAKIPDRVDREIAQFFRKDAERAERDQEIAEMRALVVAGYDYKQFGLIDETLADYYLRAREKGTFSAVEAFERKLEEVIEEEEFLLLALLSL